MKLIEVMSVGSGLRIDWKATEKNIADHIRRSNPQMTASELAMTVASTISDTRKRWAKLCRETGSSAAVAATVKSLQARLENERKENYDDRAN